MRQVCPSTERPTLLVSFGIEQIKLRCEDSGDPHVLTPQANTATVKPRGFQRNIIHPLWEGMWESEDRGPVVSIKSDPCLLSHRANSRWLRFPRKSRSGAAWTIVDLRQAGIVLGSVVCTFSPSELEVAWNRLWTQGAHVLFLILSSYAPSHRARLEVAWLPSESHRRVLEIFTQGPGSHMAL